MKLNNNVGLPNWIMAAFDFLFNSHEKMADNEYSTTTLFRPVREILLTKRHYNEIEVDVTSIVSQALGTAFHEFAEKFAKELGCIVEKRVSREITVGDTTYVISGRFDIYDPETFTLYDIKTCKKAKFENERDGIEDEWYRQGASYAEGIERIYGYRVDKFVNIVLITDYSAIQAGTTKGYPRFQIDMISHDLTTPEANEYIAETLDLQKKKILEVYSESHKDDDTVQVCSPKDRWEDVSIAVVDPKSKPLPSGIRKAKKKFETVEDALSYIENEEPTYKIEQRCGNPKKCLYYCTCREYCSHYKSLNKETSV